MNKGERWIPALGLCLAILLGCQPAAPPAPGGQEEDRAMNLETSDFGTAPGGQAVMLYSLTNAHGLRARIMTYGAIVVSLEVPDRDGDMADIVLGYDDLAGYVADNPYFGAIVGRYGNRIAGARFTLDGREYRLAANNGPNHLHGGLRGFDKVVWSAEPVRRSDAVGVKMAYTSPDGEEGYPGTLTAHVTYLLTNHDELKILYEATTDKPTVVNLTHHSYFNLLGQGRGDILGHELQILADRFTPVDDTLIPTGERRAVAGTPFDFRTHVAIGARIGAENRQLAFGGGYDHNWILDNQDGDLALAARLFEPTTGRMMEVLTTEPGLQFYSGNFLDGSITGKDGAVYIHRSGFCLETQHYPDSPNQPEFPSVVLRPGETYTQTTVYRFSAR
ncbi:MAG: galactose mutarotase [Acidobacteria bacterium]|nr:galactose mutarotase [Acidobacteriota bacterium]